MSALIERLRHGYKNWSRGAEVAAILKEAADRIEALEREVEELRAALKPFAEALEGLSENIRDYENASDYYPTSSITIGDLRRARTALVKPSEAKGGKDEILPVL